jgi:hypothetical protein
LTLEGETEQVFFGSKAKGFNAEALRIRVKPEKSKAFRKDFPLRLCPLLRLSVKY